MRGKEFRKSCGDARPSRRPEDASHGNTCSTHKLHFTDLPTDALVNIFRYCSYEDVATEIRPVCRRFCDVATMVLNSGFSTLGPKIDRAILTVKRSMPHDQNDPDLKAMIRAFNALEVMKSQVRFCVSLSHQRTFFFCAEDES